MKNSKGASRKFAPLVLLKLAITCGETMDNNLIQILYYREGINSTTGKGYFFQKLAKHISVSNSIALFKNLDSIIELIPEEERYNVHYTTAMCHQPETEKDLRRFYKQDIIPIDLDGIDLNRKEEYIDIVLNLLKLDPTKTGVFCSGNGIHIVAIVNKPFDLEGLEKLKPSYKKLCEQLNMEFYSRGLVGNADNVRLSESATLRLPLTENRKKGKPNTMSYVIQGNVEKQDLDLLQLFPYDTKEDSQSDANSTYSVDTPSVLSGCEFLKWCKENPNKVSEPQWHAMIQVLAYVPEVGTSLCHTYSKDHVSYDADQTDSKIEQAKGFGKPRTCDGIDQLWNRCSECPYYKKVKTPLQIKDESFIPTQATGFHHLIKTEKGGIKYKPDYDGLAAYFNQKHVSMVDINTNTLIRYTGKKWEEVPDQEITSFATKHFIPTATNNMRGEFLGLIKSLNVAPKDFIGKDNEGYINFNNGVLDLKTKKLVEHSPMFGFTYVLPYDYNPNADCPNFKALMDNVTLGDQDLQKVILEFVGYTISGRPNSWIQKVMVLSGEGSNGKSTFMNIIRKLVGEECYSAISIASMAKENNRYAMWGKLFNISFDEDPKALLKGGVSIFKAITAGDPIDIRRLYANPISAPINAKLIVACNKPLETNDHTHAVYRRMLIIPFRAKFTEKNENKNIADTIQGEMSGIYNLVLEALERLIRNDGRFSRSTVVDNALAEYKYESAVFQRFFEDTFVTTKDEAHFVTTQELMSEFKLWTEKNNERVDISALKLIKELKSLGLVNGDSITKYHSGSTKRGYCGIKKLDERF